MSDINSGDELHFHDASEQEIAEVGEEQHPKESPEAIEEARNAAISALEGKPTESTDAVEEEIPLEDPPRENKETTSEETASEVPPLPSRKTIDDCIRLDNIAEEDTSRLEHTAHSYNKHTQNYLLQSKYNQLNEKYNSKDAKQREQIASGTENIKKTFDTIKQTVGGFSEMFEHKIDWDFWTRIVNNYEEVILHESDQLNALIMSGIPREFRGIIWQLVAKSKNFQMEEFYLQVKKEPSLHEKSIKRDLTRTSFFTNVDQVNKADELYNVIKAYSLFDPEVGYTQGMIFITVPLIMNMSEAECFCLLVTLMKEYNVREMFCPEMKGLHLMLYEFDRLVEFYSPILYNHLAKQGIKSSMYASQWFLTFFAYKFPLDMVLRIYDIIITQGIESVLKLAVNLMIKNEQQLLQLKFDKLLEFLKDKMFNAYVNEEFIKEDGGIDPIAQKRSSTISKRFSLLATKRSSDMQTSSNSNPYYKLDAMVHDAMDINVDPVELTKYETEFERIYSTEEAKVGDIEKLRVENGKLRHTIKELETEYASFNRDHVDTVQNMVDTKVTLPEVRNDIEDLEHQIEKLEYDISHLEQKNQTEVEELPESLQHNIDELLSTNLKQTERFAELDDELATLVDEDEALTREIKQNSRKSWFGFVKA